MSTYLSESQNIARRRAIADSLRASGNEALPASIRTSGRFDAPVSGWQYANKAIAQLLGALESRGADKSQAKLDEQDKRVLADLIAAKRASEAPDVNGELDPSLQSDEGPTQVPLESKPLPKADRMAALQAATLRGQQFGGSAAPLANELTERELLPPVQNPYTLQQDGVRMSGDNKPVAVGLPSTPRESPDDRMLIDIVDPQAPQGFRTIKRADWNGEQQYYKPTGSGGGGGADDATALLDPETRRNAALDVIRNPEAMRQYATFGKYGQAIRTDINKEMTKVMREYGLTNNQVAAFRARVQGEVKSTKDLIGMKNAVASYKKLARFNGERLLELIDGVDTTGVPWLEGVIRAGKVGVGSPEAAEFQSVMKTYQTEVARIISQPRLVGQLTDTQIQEMDKVAKGAASAPQLRRVINRLNLEMDMREDGINKQLATSGGNMNIPGSEPMTGASATGAADAPVTKVIGGKTYVKTGPGPTDWEEQ